MGKLVGVVGDELHIVGYRVAGPGYIMYVADGQSGNGWDFVTNDDVIPQDYALPWKQPLTLEDAYPVGAIVTHSGQQWRSMMNNNVWEPGVSGWHDASIGIPVWVQPTGAHDVYNQGDVVQHNGTKWMSLLDANVWEPGVSGWRETAKPLPTGEVQVPAWVQPTGGHDAYNVGDRVTHNGQVWESTVASNVWEPGVYGWVVV